MVNWFYVVGSERVGPVSEIMLKGLITAGEINADSYVWRKGFSGWERLKDVAELNGADSSSENVEAEAAVVEEENSPEVRFNFDWNKVKEQEEQFYLRIGHDRKNFEGTDIYGPYSLTELREALTDKRINQNTLIFAPGMDGWMKIQHTPASAGLSGTGSSKDLTIEEVPLMIVLNHSPLPLVTVVKKAGAVGGRLLGAGPFGEYTGQTLLATLYAGNEVKARNLKVRIDQYHTKEQTIEFAFESLDSQAKKIMLNHAV